MFGDKPAAAAAAAAAAVRSAASPRMRLFGRPTTGSAHLPGRGKPPCNHIAYRLPLPSSGLAANIQRLGHHHGSSKEASPPP